jgi:ATP-binding cassette subfamily B protein
MTRLTDKRRPMAEREAEPGPETQAPGAAAITYVSERDREQMERPLSMALIRRLFEYTRPYAAKRNGLLIIVLIRSIQLPCLAAVLSAVIDGPITDHHTAGIVWGVVIFGALAVFTEIVFHFRARWAAELGEEVIHDLRRDIFDHIQYLTMSYFDKTKVGRLISRMTSDAEAVRVGVQDVLFVSLVQLGQGVVAGMFMAFYNWKLFLVVLAVAPLLYFIIDYFRKKLSTVYRDVQESFSRLTATLAESVTGIRVTQGFARQDVNAGLFNELLYDHADYNMNVARTAGLFLPLLEFNAQMFMAVVLAVGGYQVLAPGSGVDPGDLIAFFFFVPLFFQPCSVIGRQYNQALRAMAGAERVFRLLDTKPEWSDPPDAIELPQIEGRVEFRHVGFSYVPGKPVLHDVNFIAEPGQTIALVGETGSGKSTIVNLIAKFYLPTEGELLVDGYDITNVTTDSLQQQLGIVLQQNFLFTGTVIDNIRIGRPDASDEDVREAAKKLDCLDLLEAMPDGLYTYVGEKGGGISLGQRQLICFTRAMLADPRILILDEATSAVDTMTEARIQKALETLLRNRTNFVVAHRLSTIRHADTVLVLDQGRIVERGSHTELLKEGGIYANLYRQFLHATMA